MICNPVSDTSHASYAMVLLSNEPRLGKLEIYFLKTKGQAANLRPTAGALLRTLLINDMLPETLEGKKAASEHQHNRTITSSSSS